MDYLIREFQQKIVLAINEAELPIEVKRLALAEILNSIGEASNKVIAEQISERSKNEQALFENKLAE